MTDSVALNPVQNIEQIPAGNRKRSSSASVNTQYW